MIIWIISTGAMNSRHILIKNILEKQLAIGRLAHAYLFVGPKGNGKKDLARELAGKLLGLAEANIENLLRHPDYAELDCLQDANAELVRDFIGRIALKPFLAKTKFALISNIEDLNSQGANALLKMLEEPPENTVMVLTADTRKVLPTIISRCQIFNFNRPAKTISSLDSHLAQEGEIKIVDLAGKTLSERLLAINNLADLDEQELIEAVEDFIFEGADSLRQNPENYRLLAAGLKAFEDLKTNKNRKLVLQGLMLKI